MGQEQSPKPTPYRTGWTTEGIIFGSALTVAFTASALDDNIPTLSLSEIYALDKNTINPIDRITAGNFSRTQSKISDVLVAGCISSPFLLMLDDGIRRDVNTISTMYLETVLFSTFTPSYGKGSVRRIRPYVYGNTASLADKQDSDSRRSFFSGHATWAFSTAVFFANVYLDYHPDSEYKNYIWGGAIGLASSVSILRVTSGAHFISDIIVGAAVGSTIGYVIPYLHRNTSQSLSFAPSIGPDYRGIMFSYHIQ
jgi:membrane-associated phospholipid phosphatase